MARVSRTAWQALREAPHAFAANFRIGRVQQIPKSAGAVAWQSPLNVIAKMQGLPAGLISATRLKEGRIELISTWVAQEARGKGVGEALVKEVLRWAQDQGATWVVFEVYPSNEHAIRLYERLGFEVEASTVGPLGPLRMAQRCVPAP